LSEIALWKFDVENIIGDVTWSLHEFVEKLGIEAYGLEQKADRTVNFAIGTHNSTVRTDEEQKNTRVTVYLNDNNDSYNGFAVYETNLFDLRQNGWT
jgi:hypothetical protein